MRRSSARSFREFRNSKDSTKPHYLVVGHPISHSLSPVMHTMSLTYHGLSERYYAVDVPTESITDFISWMNRDNFRGCNITIPWKQQLLSVPDQLSPEVKAIGAMNTIVKSVSSNHTILAGHNTDIHGFWEPLTEYEALLDFNTAIVFGSGGASRAVQYALAEAGYAEIIVVSRRPGGANPLQTNAFTKAVDYTQWQSYCDNADLIINTTPLGMGSLQRSSPVQDTEIDLLKGKICYDLVYNPRRTCFLDQGINAGAEIINGLDMLIQQGNRSFKLWTGKEFPVDNVRSQLVQYLES